MARLVDRETECRELRELAERPGAHMAVLYGRRRIGKTHLLQHLWEDDSVFYYLASDISPAFNRREFVQELAAYTGRDDELQPEDLGSWRAVFRELFRVGADGDFVAVIDEFQYLVGGDDEIRSQLVAVWDKLEVDASLLVVLCGSAVRTMRELDDAQAPLYGRIDWKHHLRAFDYWNAGELAPFEDHRDRARTYGVFGGTPDYLASLDPEQSFEENVSRLALSPRGRVRHLVESALERERGLRNVAQYRSILTAIARGRTGISEIADVTGMEAGTPLRRKIGRLEDLGFVEGRRNFDASTTSPYRYRLRDPASTFNYGVVESLRNELETDEPDEIWDDLVVPRLRTHMGHVFERIVRQAYFRLRGPRGLPTVSEWGYWEGRDRNKNSIEIDIVARLSHGSMLTGEIKWNRTPVDASIYRDHVRNLTRLADSGRSWAHDALEDPSTFLFAAAGGFDDEFDAVADAADQTVLRWTLEDIYSEEAAHSSNIAP